MAYANATRARDDVTDPLNGEMMAVLMERSCPKCNCAESRPVESDEGDHEVNSLPLRVCVECNELYGFDDSTSAPDHLLPRDQDETYGGHIWNDDDDYDDDDHDGPLVPIPCFRDDEWSRPGHEDQAVDHYHAGFPPRRGRGRGRRGHGGGCGHGRGRGHHHHHHQWEDRSDNCHHHHHQRACQRGRGGNRHRRNGAPLKQLADTCVQSGCKCAPGVATSLVTGDYGGALMTVSDEMEPIGRAVGSAVGSVAGNVLGSPQAADIAADMGSVVGRGMAEMLKDSRLNNRRASSHYD